MVEVSFDVDGVFGSVLLSWTGVNVKMYVIVLGFC
jgi:hypothetical protein